MVLPAKGVGIEPRQPETGTTWQDPAGPRCVAASVGPSRFSDIVRAGRRHPGRGSLLDESFARGGRRGSSRRVPRCARQGAPSDRQCFQCRVVGCQGFSAHRRSTWYSWRIDHAAADRQRRKGWGSNPRRLAARRFSRPVLSTTQPSLHETIRRTLSLQPARGYAGDSACLGRLREP